MVIMGLVLSYRHAHLRSCHISSLLTGTWMSKGVFVYRIVPWLVDTGPIHTRHYALIPILSGSSALTSIQ